jgi:hypothetical protein
VHAFLRSPNDQRTAKSIAKQPGGKIQSASTEQFAITTELFLFFIPPTRMANFKETKTTIHYNAVHPSSWMNSQRHSKGEKTSDY